MIADELFLTILAQPVETELPHVEVKDFYPFIALSGFWEAQEKKD